LLKQKDLQNKRRLTKIAKELFREYLKEKSVQKSEDKKDTNVENCLPLFCLPVKQCIIKQLFDSVFAISGIIKVSVSVISLSWITVTSTLIIPDIAKTSSNNCLLSIRLCIESHEIYTSMALIGHIEPVVL